MRFAQNYSDEAVQLVGDGTIQFDLYKMPDWENLVDETIGEHPLYVHFGIAVGSEPESQPGVKAWKKTP